MRDLGGFLSLAFVAAHDQQPLPGQSLCDFPILAEPFPGYHPAGRLGGAAATAHQGQHDAADPSVREPAEQVLVGLFRMTAQRTGHPADALVGGEGDHASLLMPPQLRQGEFQQRKPAPAASILSDELDQAVLIAHAPGPGRFGDHLLQLVPAHW